MENSTTRKRKNNERSLLQTSSFFNDGSHPHSTSYSQQSFSPPSLSSSSSFQSTSIPQDWGTVISQQLGRVLSGIVWYIWDLILGTLMILRPLFSFFLAIVAILLILGALTRGLSIFKSEVQLRIVCKVPLVSYVITCPSRLDTTDPAMLHVPNFADLVNKQAASYELIADSLNSLNPGFIQKKLAGKKTRKRDKIKKLFLGRKSNSGEDTGNVGDSGEGDDDTDEEDPHGLVANSLQGGPPLPLLLKRAELAVVDLKVLVKHSSLGDEPKMLLVDQLQAFHTRAKMTSRQLQFLQARANGCLDGLVIRNVYLTVELDRLEQHQQLLAREGDRVGIWDKVLDLFSAGHDLQIAASERKLQQLYQSSMDNARNHIRDLILQAQEVLQSLDKLDTILSTIHEIATQETRQQNQAHEETLAQLWSRFGGNRLERELYRENLELLRNMEGQRKATVGQIQAALWKLTDFEAEIGILREKIVDATVDATIDKGPQVVIGPSGSGSDSSGGYEGLGTMSLKAHIQQIDLVTSRLKDRGFLAEGMVKAQAGKIQDLTEDVPESPTP